MTLADQLIERAERMKQDDSDLERVISESLFGVAAGTITLPDGRRIVRVVARRQREWAKGLRTTKARLPNLPRLSRLAKSINKVAK